MSTQTLLRLTVGAIALWLAGCQTAEVAKMPTAKAPAVDAACTITQASYLHIHARHCVPGQGTRLRPEYCTLEGMQNFCAMVQNAPNKTRVVQVDGRIRYDANLGMVVGVTGEKCGRMVMEPTGEVVTEFPEDAGAPTPPACT